MAGAGTAHGAGELNVSQDGRDYDEVLRRILRDAAASVEVDDGGLEQIRARLGTPRRLAVAWLLAACAAVGAVLRRWLQTAVELVWRVAGRLRPSGSPGAAGPGPRARQRRPPRLSLLSAAAAAGAIAVLAVIGVLSPASLPGQAIHDTAALLSHLIGERPAHPPAGSSQGGQNAGGAGSGPGTSGGSGSPSATCTRQASGPTPGGGPHCRPGRPGKHHQTPAPGLNSSVPAPPPVTGSPAPTPTPSSSSPAGCPTPSTGTSPGPSASPGTGASSPCPTVSPSPAPTGTATTPASTPSPAVTPSPDTGSGSSQPASSPGSTAASPGAG